MPHANRPCGRGRAAFRLTLLLAAAAIAPAQAAHAQERTPANAFAFIRDNVANGAWTGEYEQCDEYRENCNPDLAPVMSVSYLGGTYCHLRFTMNAPNNPVRDIDLTKAFSIYNSYGSFWFSGPVRIYNGDVRSQWRMYAPSAEIGERVFAAITYIQNLCKPATVW